MEERNSLDLDQVRKDITEKANMALGQAVEFAREQPHVAVGAALAIGWVLGNGLPPRLLTSAARMGWRAMIGGAIAGGTGAGLLNQLIGGIQQGATTLAQQATGGESMGAMGTSSPRASSSVATSAPKY